MIKRLAYWGDLDNLGDNNDKIYADVVDYINQINNLLDNSENINDDLIYQIRSLYEDINYDIDTAKGNGQDNEDQLGKGNDIISELENDMNDVQSQIDNIQNQIDDIQYEIDNNSYASSRLRKLHKETELDIESVRKFICHTHDDIMSDCKEGIKICNSFQGKLNDLEEDEENIEVKMSDIFTEFNDEVKSTNNNILSYIDEATDSNNRMSEGINNKNNKIEQLREELKELQDELLNKENELSDKENELDDLKNI